MLEDWFKSINRERARARAHTHTPHAHTHTTYTHTHTNAHTHTHTHTYMLIALAYFISLRNRTENTDAGRWKMMCFETSDFIIKPRNFLDPSLLWDDFVRQVNSLLFVCLFLFFIQLRTAALRLIVRSWLDVPTFATGRLQACHHARAPSGGRWNCGREMSSNFA
jgi:hypothetical protein